MELGFVEDFSSNIQLDQDLFAIPTSGLYLNSGVKPAVTINNLLQFLPLVNFSLGSWSVGITYDAYLPERNRGNLVSDGTYVYQSLQDNNQGNPLNDTSFWRKTTFESIHLKNMIQSVKDRVNADLNITKRLVNNQFIYNEGRNTALLPNDYAAWVIEPKGSDYVSFRINQIALQTTVTGNVSVYVVNQGVLVATLAVPSHAGRLEFESVDYTFSGKGKWHIMIDSQNVLLDGGYIDPLKYDGFVAYTATGTGATPQTATWSYGTAGNGIGLNITAFLDASLYIENNINEFANFIRAAFVHMFYEMMQSNANSRSNREQRIQMDEKVLLFQLTDLQSDTVVKRYNDEKKKAFRQIEKTFDTQLFSGDDNNTILDVKLGW
jgi:hypothetical protein